MNRPWRDRQPREQRPNRTRHHNIARLRLQSQANELLRLVRAPIFRFIELRRQDLNRDEMVHGMILEYLGLLRTAKEEFIREGTPLPERLQPALKHIQKYQRDYIEENKTAHYI